MPREVQSNDNYTAPIRTLSIRGPFRKSTLNGVLKKAIYPKFRSLRSCRARLARYGCPPNLFETITRMYKDSVVKLVIGEFETTIDFKVGVKQGDSVAPVLFLFIVMAFAEKLKRNGRSRESPRQNSHATTIHLYLTAISSAINHDLSTAERSSSSSVCSTSMTELLSSNRDTYWKLVPPCCCVTLHT